MMLQRSATVIENVPIAERTFRIRLRCPEIAAAIRPGQFLMVRLPGTTDPLLGRPFALYDTVLEQGEAIGLDVVYLVVGKMTGLLAQINAGEPVEVWGPLGNGFPEFDDVEQVTFVAGGIGQTPFLAYARDLLGERGYGGRPARRRVQRVALYYGVRNKSLAAGVADFESAGCPVHLASDDGSVGQRGFVTELLAKDRLRGPIVGCGPEPMLHALAKLTAEWGVECHVSLETPMACGFGACFSCVTKVQTPAGWDYKRVCVEGPVFNAKELDWA